MNILATIPKAAFKTWEVAERICQRCDGTTDWGNGEWFWTINCKSLPKKIREDSVCFMIYEGIVRGYFDIVDTDSASNWSNHKAGYCLVMANWHPIAFTEEHKGFQGYRYTELIP